LIAKEFLSDILIPLKPSDSGNTALGIMDELRVSHLPIVTDVDYIGLLSDVDIYNVNDPREAVGNLKLSVPRIYVNEPQHFYDVLRLFAEHHLTLLPVLNEKNQYSGVVMLSSLVNRLSEIYAIDNPGGIIVLEVNDKDYLLTEIARIIESNDAKVLSMYITSFPDSTKLEITLKINKLDIGPVLQTFSRFNYTIKASFAENTYFETLQERYDSLMNYLNI
jgi:acetoin utilization protein AcuB